MDDLPERGTNLNGNAGFAERFTLSYTLREAVGTADDSLARPSRVFLLSMISQKAKYALRALVALARAPQGDPVVISEIARAQRIPKKFLEQILLDLKRHGLLASRRGKGGGYVLLRPADDITYGEVLRIVDGPIAPLPCLSITAYRRCHDCADEALCETRHVFSHVAAATRKVLDNTTIADALASASRVTELAS